jgi:hypothetical protein
MLHLPGLVEPGLLASQALASDHVIETTRG